MASEMVELMSFSAATGCLPQNNSSFDKSTTDEHCLNLEASEVQITEIFLARLYDLPEVFKTPHSFQMAD